MTNFEELQQALETLRKYNLPISPILEYSINEKIEEFLRQEHPLSPLQKDNSSIHVQANALTFDEQPNRFANTLKRKSASILRATRPDGSIIQKDKAADTFCQVIKEIGAQKVMSLNIILDETNLVQNDFNNQYSKEFHSIGNGYFVNTHSNTATKKRQLDKIFKAFNLNWNVEIVESN